MKLKVLIAEDSKTTSRLISLYLKEFTEVELDIVENGFEAIIKLQKKVYDLVITDIVMPIMDGYKLVSYIRNQSPHSDIPIIIITRKGTTQDTERGDFVGTNYYLIKPFKKQQLQKIIDEITKKKERECDS